MTFPLASVSPRPSRKIGAASTVLAFHVSTTVLYEVTVFARVLETEAKLSARGRATSRLFEAGSTACLAREAGGCEGVLIVFALERVIIALALNEEAKPPFEGVGEGTGKVEGGSGAL